MSISRIKAAKQYQNMSPGGRAALLESHGVQTGIALRESDSSYDALLRAQSAIIEGRDPGIAGRPRSINDRESRFICEFITSHRSRNIHATVKSVEDALRQYQNIEENGERTMPTTKTIRRFLDRVNFSLSRPIPIEPARVRVSPEQVSSFSSSTWA